MKKETFVVLGTLCLWGGLWVIYQHWVGGHRSGDRLEIQASFGLVFPAGGVKYIVPDYSLANRVASGAMWSSSSSGVILRDRQLDVSPSSVTWGIPSRVQAPGLRVSARAVVDLTEGCWFTNKSMRVSIRLPALTTTAAQLKSAPEVMNIAASSTFIPPDVFEIRVCGNSDVTRLK